MMVEIVVFKKEDFRRWLKKNHDKEKKVAVIVHKKHTGRGSPSHRELMEEAICFGWIDTTIKRLDDDRYIRHFARRSKNSRWSDNTQGYAKKLIEEGRMTKYGMKFYEDGLKKPVHDHGIPKDPEMPLDLKKALLKGKVLEKFERFAPSKKRAVYGWFLSAKLIETKKKRIEKIVSSAKEGKSVF